VIALVKLTVWIESKFKIYYFYLLINYKILLQVVLSLNFFQIRNLRSTFSPLGVNMYKGVFKTNDLCKILSIISRTMLCKGKLIIRTSLFEFLVKLYIEPKVRNLISWIYAGFYIVYYNEFGEFQILYSQDICW
jgi:hypothetical protein